MSALCWSLRFVEDFSDDILAALGEYRPLVGVTQRRTSLTEAARSSSAKAKAAWLADRVDALLDDHRHRRASLCPAGHCRPARPNQIDAHRQVDRMQPPHLHSTPQRLPS